MRTEFSAFVVAIWVSASPSTVLADSQAPGKPATTHLLSLSAQAGPSFWANNHPCGSQATCPKFSVAFAGTLLVRPMDALSVGLSVVHHPYGTVNPGTPLSLGSPLVAYSTRALHIDVVARYNFGPTGRFLPWAQFGIGPATVYATCVEGGREHCGADPIAPTDDEVSGISIRPSGGVDFAVTNWFFANAALEALTITNGEGHACFPQRGACASAPGTRIAPTLFLGVTFGVL